MGSAGDAVLAEDVVLLYERALGRSPAPAEIEHQMLHAPDLRTLVRAVLESEEYAQRGAVAATPAEVRPPLPSLSATDPGAVTWAERFPPPDGLWTPEYGAGHEALVSAAIDDVALCDAVAGQGGLPDGYAVGYDERVVEYPWAFGHSLAGRMLDAGSTFNHSHILDRLLPRIDDLTIATLAPEAASFPSRGISYVFGDLRELPFRDGWFDLVVSLSTLEHVGMDNATYGAAGRPAADVDRAVTDAATELRRVVRRGGRILFSVPFGARENHGWFRQFDRRDLEYLIEAFGVPRDAASVAIFAYDRRGWRRSSLSDAARLRYRDAHADPSPVEDLAAAARAVACVALQT